MANRIKSINGNPIVVDSSGLESNAVTTAKIADNAVIGDKINDLAVRTEKLANNAVTSEKIAPYTITYADISVTGTDRIHQDNLNDDSVGTRVIANRAVTPEKLSDSVLSYVSDELFTYCDEKCLTQDSVNLINPNAANKKNNIAVMYGSGTVISNQDYATLVLPVDGGETMVCNQGNCHITFYSRFVDIRKASVGDVLNVGRISGILASSGTPFEVPSSATYMAFSAQNRSINNGTARLNYGETIIDVDYTKVDMGNVAERVDDIEKGLENKIDATYGKNRFDQNTENKLVGFYAVSTSGRISANVSFNVYAIPIDGGSTISINLSANYHVAFFSQLSDISNMAAGSVIPGYISGFANQSGANKSVPDNAVMMTISITATAAGSVQVEYGSASTSYEPYMKGLPASNVLGLSDFVNNRTLVVGSGMTYANIADAVAVASDGDTILIMPGTYREAVDCRDKKVRLKGLSRDSVTLVYSNADYQNPPLEMTKGLVEDVTIVADGQNTTGGNGAYCAHVDFYQEVGESLQFKNVRFYNDALGIGRPCVGIGLRQNYRLSFVNCEFESALGHTIYCHEQQESNKSNQYVEFIDCSVVSHASQGPAILLQETPALENTSATIRMQRCIVKNLAGGSVISANQYGTHPGLIYEGYLGTKLWTLDDMSAMNSADILNA